MRAAWRRFWTHRIPSNHRLARGRWWATSRVRGSGSSTRKGEDALPLSEASGVSSTPPQAEREVVTRFAAPDPHPSRFASLRARIFGRSNSVYFGRNVT